MRYFYTLPSLLLFLLLLITCNFNSEKTKLFEKAGIVSNDNAVNIIHYNNGLVQLTDAQLEYITYVNRNLKIIEEGLEKNSSAISINKITDVFYYNIKDLSNVNEELPRGAFEQVQINFFEKNVDLMNQTFENIRMNYQTLENHIISQDYQSDKGSDVKSHLKMVQQYVDEYFVVSDLVMNEIISLSNEAEKEILKDHPLKEFIFSMQESSDLVSGFVDRIHEHPKLFMEDQAIYDRLMLEIYDSQKKVASINQKPLEEHSEKRVFYEGFLGALNDFQITAKKNLDQSKKTGKFTNEQLNELLITEEYLRNFYNDFVD